MTKIHQYTILCAPILSQMAACEALQAGKKSLELMKKEYNRRRDFMHQGLNEIGLSCDMPQGAFYIFPSIEKSGLSSLDFAKKLLNQQKVAVVPGVAFGKEYDNYIRISYATNYLKLQEAIKCLKVFLDKA